MTIIEQIKAEIRRRIKENESWKDFHRSKGETTNFDDVKIVELQSIISFLSTLEPEKPMELEKEIKRYYDDMDGDCRYAQTARHFYDLGCRRTAEKYDEIEYNRQRAEEQGSEGLEEEIKRYLHSLGVGYGGWVDGMDDDDLRGIARHFAQWGAEHFRDLTKKMGDSSEIPADLEEAAEQFYPQDSFDTQAARELGVACFVDGAKWDREQMMKDGLEGEVRKDGTIGYLEFSNDQQFHSLLEQFQDCDKVRIIIVKED